MKKLLAVVMCAILLLGLFPAQVNAKSMDAKLAEAIGAVKEKVVIPDSYSEFDYYFGTPQSYADSYLDLMWSNPTDNSSIRISCDKDNHIIYYDVQDYSVKTNQVPKYLKSELKTTADDFIKKIAPDIYSKLEYVTANFTNVYEGGYEFRYQRLENGIPFPDNYVTVTVDSTTGKVKTTFVHWLYNATVPSSQVKITSDDAYKLLKKNITMELSYKSNYIMFYSNNIEKAFLVYQPDKQYIAVDAKTGKLYTTNNNTAIDNIGYGTKEDAATSATADNGTVQLTEQEIDAIETLKNLITKEEAIKKITQNKYLLIDKNLKKTTATLSKNTDNTGKDTYIWNIEMSDPREVNEKKGDTYRAIAWAQVNAQTGKIMQFYASVKDYYNEKEDKWEKVSIPYDKKECKKTLEAFLKKEVSSRFKNSKLSDQTSDYIAYYTEKNKPVYGGYSYTYNRVNENVEYSDNSIYGSVDGITGKIYSFGSYWNDNVVFESTKGILSKNQALDSYLSMDGYHLVYEVNQVNKYDSKDSIGTNEYEIRLVYRTDLNPNYISPFSGKQMNYDGTVYTEAKAFTYADIENIALYRSVLLLADMNVGFEGNYFYPSKEITAGELYHLFEQIGYGAQEISGKDTNGLITREELAYYFVKCLSLDKVSTIPGIYTTGYNDQSSIDSKYLGAVAIAKGLGIVSGDNNNNFNPKSNVTRLDAANMLVNFIKVQREGVF